MGTREAIIRIKLQPGQFNSAIRDMQSKVQSAGRKMGESLREPLRKGIEAGASAARGLANEIGGAVKMAATLGGAVSTGALIRSAAESEKAYIQIASAVSMFGDKAFDAADAQKLIEDTAIKTKTPIKELQAAMVQLAGSAKDGDLPSLLERAAEQARRLGMESSFIGEVYQKLVTKGLAKSGEEAEKLTDEINKMMRVVVGEEWKDALNPRDVAELAGFINTTGEEAGKMLKVLRMGGGDIAKDFGKFTESVEELGISLGHTKGIDEMRKKLGLGKGVINEKQSALENMLAVADKGPAKFEKMINMLAGDIATPAMKNLLGGDEFIKAARYGKVSKDDWNLRVKKVRDELSSVDEAMRQRQDIEKIDAAHKNTMSAKFDDAMNKLQMAMMKPEVIKSMNSLADDLPKLAESLAKIISFIAENPMFSLAGIAHARIGAAALGGFGRSLFGGGGGGGGGGGFGSFSGRGGKGPSIPSDMWDDPKKRQIWGGMMNAGDVGKGKKISAGKVAMSAGQVLFAAEMGVMIGTAISKFVVQPLAADAAKARAGATNLISSAQQKATAGDRAGALKDLQAAMSKNKESLYSLDTVIGTVTSVFDGTEAPLTKFANNVAVINKEAAKIEKSINEDMRKKAAEEMIMNFMGLGESAAKAAKQLDGLGGKNNARGTGKLKTKPGSEPVKQSE